MSVLNVNITSGRPDSYLQSNFETAGGKQAIATRLINFVTSLSTGSELAAGVSTPPSIAFAVQGAAVQASATLTFTAVIATDAFSINGVTFTAVASGATANQFNIGADDTETAANAAAAVNASVTALVAGYVVATSALTVVTITSAFYGTAGNQTTIASADSTIVASGSRLAGGAVDPNALTISF